MNAHSKTIYRKELYMKKASKEKKEIIEDVMHEFKQGDLKTRGGKKVTNPRQAVAIGLSESGSSQYASKKENEHNLRHTREKRAKAR
jgi:hypothetical protein